MTTPGVLANFHEVDPSAVDEFERWHTAEHLPERLAIPGFRRGRRFAAFGGAKPDYFILYETDSVDVLRSKPYLERLNAPTPRMLAVLRDVPYTSRTAAAVRVRRGDGSGGAVGAWRITAPPTPRPGLLAWLCTDAIDTALAVEGVASAMLLEGNPDVSGVPTAERDARQGPDDLCDLLLVIEGHSIAAVGEACQRLQPLQAHGAAPGDQLGFFSLQVELH